MRATDLFMAGLGFDIAGAVFLARGLLASPANMARRRRMYSDFSAPLAVGQARDRVDGEVGVVALVGGFVCQAVGYEIAPFLSSEDRGSVLTVAVGLAFTTAAIVVVVLARRAMEGRVLRLLVQLAYFATGYAGGKRLDRPSAVQLSHYGREYGIEMTPAERAAISEMDEPRNGHVSYAERIFKVDATLQGGAALHHGDDA
jgi:hypothetical protein